MDYFDRGVLDGEREHGGASRKRSAPEKLKPGCSAWKAEEPPGNAVLGVAGHLGAGADAELAVSRNE
jgi:hypothetical protein